MSAPNIIRWDQAYNRNGDAKLPRAAVNVIRTYMDNDTLSGWVSQETLIRDTGLSESQVRRQIKANVESGWLYVVKLGRSGMATDYQLTYPQPVIDDRFDKGTVPDPTGHGCPVESQEVNRSQMTGYTPQPVIDDRLQPVIDDTPTSPRTSPQEKFSIETDPFGGDRVSHETSNRSEATSPTQPVIDDRLGNAPDGAPLAPGPDWVYKSSNRMKKNGQGTWQAWMPPRGSDEDPVWF